MTSPESAAAHARIEPTKAETCDRIMTFAVARGNGGITADEVAAAFDCDHNHTSPRITELRDGGQLIATDRTRPTRSGSPARVLVAKQFSEPAAADRMAQVHKWIADARAEVAQPGATLFDIGSPDRSYLE